MQSGFVILFRGSSWKSWFRALFSNSSTFPGIEGFKHFAAHGSHSFAHSKPNLHILALLALSRAPLCFHVCMCVHKWLEDIDHHSFLRHQAKQVLSWGSAAADAHLAGQGLMGQGQNLLPGFVFGATCCKLMLLKTSLKES